MILLSFYTARQLNGSNNLILIYLTFETSYTDTIFTTPWTNSTDDKLIVLFFFFLFFPEIGYDISCKLFLRDTILGIQFACGLKKKSQKVIC